MQLRLDVGLCEAYYRSFMQCLLWGWMQLLELYGFVFDEANVGLMFKVSKNLI
jgi:hypothetical protein